MSALVDGTAVRTVVHPSGNWTMLPDTGDPPIPEQRIGTVQWYVPFARVHPDTVAGAPTDAIWVDVSSSPTAYFGMLQEIWARGETFALLEHDVVCRPDVIAAMESRLEPWVSFGYSDICHVECMEAWRDMLGCTRFRAELLEAVPDAVSSIPAEGRDWHELCNWLGGNLRAAGFSHAWGFPWVEHHHMGRHA